MGSVQPPPPSSGYPSYPQQAPPGGYGGYSAIAGPSFTTAPVSQLETVYCVNSTTVCFRTNDLYLYIPRDLPCDNITRDL